MTSPGMDRSEGGNPRPIDVRVNNFPESARPRKTSMATVVLDPTGATGQTKWQVSDYEPTRVRTVIQVLDSPCTLIVEETPRGPDTTAVGVAPAQGRVLVNNTGVEYILLGADAMWLNSIVGSVAGRVTITKEYL